jgi:hypothetical protein
MIIGREGRCKGKAEGGRGKAETSRLRLRNAARKALRSRKGLVSIFRLPPYGSFTPLTSYANVFVTTVPGVL